MTNQRRIPWAQRSTRGMPIAREAAIAVEAVLERYITDPVALDRMLNTVELGLNNALRTLAAGRQIGTGFDPSTGTPSRSALEYTQPARTAEQIRQQMEQERLGRAAVAHSGSVTPQRSSEVADPAAQFEQAPNYPQPQPRAQPNAQPQRPRRTDMPWL